MGILTGNSCSSSSNLRNGNQARLLEDEADLEYMKGNLQKMEDLTQRMVPKPTALQHVFLFV